jgi:hypothetical protein
MAYDWSKDTTGSGILFCDYEECDGTECCECQVRIGLENQYNHTCEENWDERCNQCFAEQLASFRK